MSTRVVTLFLLVAAIGGGFPVIGGTLASPDDDVPTQAAALLDQGQGPEALRRLREWCDAAPDEAARWLSAAQVLMSRGGHVDAQSFTARAAALQPDDRMTLQLHATALLLGRESRAAQQVLEPLAQRHPDDPDVAFQLGMAQAANQEFQQAADAFDRALALQPDNGMFHFWAGDNCERLNRMEAAARHLRAALDGARPAPDAAWKLATVLVHQTRIEEADEAFRQAITGPPGRSRQRARFHYGVFLFEQQRDAEAEPMLAQVTREWPEHRLAWYYLARVQRRRGQLDSAAASVTRYRALQAREYELEEAALLSLIQDRLRGR